MTQRTMIAAVFVQARAYDGLKRSEKSTRLHPNQDPRRFLEREIAKYKRLKADVARYKYHRPRLAYAIRVYAKDS